MIVEILKFEILNYAFNDYGYSFAGVMIESSMLTKLLLRRGSTPTPFTNISYRLISRIQNKSDII